MSIVNKSRSEMIDELVDYEVGIMRSMSINTLGAWVKTVLVDGLTGYNQMADEEIAIMYSAIIMQQDRDLAEGGE